jgi:hypothetical protein
VERGRYIRPTRAHHAVYKNKYKIRKEKGMKNKGQNKIK